MSASDRTTDTDFCLCADPENCIQRVPGYRCKRDFMPKYTGDAVRDVLIERQRQISAEGWDAVHDDKHSDGCLAMAGAAYAAYAGAETLQAWAFPHTNRASQYQHMARELWPFDRKWWKPKNPRRDLVRAAALILAEIERLDRLSNRPHDDDPYNLEGLQP